MRLRKPLSILLSLSMIAGMSVFASNAAVTSDESVSAGNYYNANYLESYASKAYNESGLGSVYSKTSTTWKTWSPDASSVKLKLYTTGSDNEAGASAIGTYDMKKDSSTGVWSLNLSGDYKNKYYTYLVTVNGTTKETQDVYSQAVGVNGNRTMVVDLDSTDPSGWSDDKHVLFNSASEAAVWEVHVRDFSVSKNSGVSEDNKGKYLAFAEGGTTLNSDTSSSAVSTGIDYLVEQGINCVQLMPVYDYGSVKEDVASSSSNRNWGYDPVNYNAPEGSYSTNPYDGNTRITEFKQMIQALHDRGISVVMDVVYNHTFSTDSCFNRTVPGYYYRMHSSSAYSNGSGCGNETASDKLMYRKYMIESVKYWAEEYHIDGFRFDLASILGRNEDGTPMDKPPLLKSLAFDPILGGVKLIAEAWDAGGLYQVGSFPSWNRWAEWNGRYRDDLRRFLKGDSHLAWDAAQRITGSRDLYDPTYRGYNASVNFLTCHDGFTLYDMYSYNEKHNLENGWNNTDGANDNNSWNCGAEGDTNDYNINKLRIKMIKNAFATLMCSQGPALFLAGDEFCNTQFGNNNAYCQDNIISWLDWTRKEKHKDVFEFFKYMIAFRKRFHIITDSRGKATCSYPPVSIHSNVAWSAKYYDDTRMIGIMYAGVSLKQQGLDEFVYFGVNAYWDYVNVELPDLPEGYHWKLYVNTGNEPQDVILEDRNVILYDRRINMAGRSVIVAVGERY